MNKQFLIHLNLVSLMKSNLAFLAKPNPALVYFGLVFLLGLPALAMKNCTDEPKSKWMSEEAFKKMVESQGYTIKKFKQPGTCYEVYGTDRDGKKIEIYFNPVDGSVKHKFGG